MQFISRESELHVSLLSNFSILFSFSRLVTSSRRLFSFRFYLYVTCTVSMFNLLSDYWLLRSLEWETPAGAWGWLITHMVLWRLTSAPIRLLFTASVCRCSLRLRPLVPLTLFCGQNKIEILHGKHERIYFNSRPQQFRSITFPYWRYLMDWIVLL